MVHAKTAVVDGEVTLIGSSNLDPLSMRRNYELNLLVADAATGAAMRAMFAADLREATRIDPTAWRRRPVWQRVLETAAGLFRPNLVKGRRHRHRARVARDRPPPRDSPHTEALRGHSQGAIIDDEGPPLRYDVVRR